MQGIFPLCLCKSARAASNGDEQSRLIHFFCRSNSSQRMSDVVVKPEKSEGKQTPEIDSHDLHMSLTATGLPRADSTAEHHLRYQRKKMGSSRKTRSSHWQHSQNDNLFLASTDTYHQKKQRRSGITLLSSHFAHCRFHFCACGSQGSMVTTKGLPSLTPRYTSGAGSGAGR